MIQIDHKLMKILNVYQRKSEALIPILQETQKQFGYLSKKNMLVIARFLRIPDSRVYAVATFYSQFRFSPIGKHHCMVCRGTACHVKGAAKILQELKTKLNIDENATTPDGEFSLETVACIGACGLAPTMIVNDKTYGRLTAKKVSEIIDALQ